MGSLATQRPALTPMLRQVYDHVETYMTGARPYHAYAPCNASPPDTMAEPSSLSRVEKTLSSSPRLSSDASVSHVEVASVGAEHLSKVVPPHESYEGAHRWDPDARWSAQEEKALVWKTDLYLLSMICLMVRRLHTATSALD